VHSSIKCC